MEDNLAINDQAPNDPESNETKIFDSESDNEIKYEHSDQSVTQRVTQEVEFEGSPEEFRNFFINYAATHKRDSFPHRWIESKRSLAFMTEKNGADGSYMPAVLSVSPLPNSRALLSFIIPTIFEEEYFPICQRLVDHLRDVGWVNPKDNRENPQKKAKKKNDNQAWKNRPRQDVIIPVAVALYAYEKADCRTLTDAAKKFHVHTGTIKKYKELPEVQNHLTSFRKDESLYGKLRMQANEIVRRKISPELKKK